MTKNSAGELCIDVDDLLAHRSGQLSAEEVAALESHLAHCSSCRQLFSALAWTEDRPRPVALPSGSADSTSPTLPAAPPAGGLELAPGARVGRFVVLGRLGAGGMGVVYSAHDPELDRKVALKLLRLGRVAASDRASYRERLLREARAMAQLAHPNVVAVYEVGSFGEEVFIAMELVEGQTLARWLAAEPRSPREVVATFLQAGHGLAAAHAAGLIHRDFKPDNVLVGNDGRVRVTDFGLARTTEAASSDGPASGQVAPSPMSLTVSGALVGTPYYMAPEQYRGEPTSARTDEFSFCVALWSALAGGHPFIGDTTANVVEAMTAARLRPRTGRDPMPRWLRRVLTRGLHADAEQRFPSMNDLLSALAQEPARRLRRRVAAAAALVALLGGGLAYRANRPRLVCRGAERQLAGVWDPGRAQAIERAFAATGKPYAPAAFVEVRRMFDAFARSWVAMRTDACEATRVRGDQSDELLGLRMMCLDARLRGVRVLSERFASADGEAVEHAPRAVNGIDDLAGCADAQALLGGVRPPADPAVRAQLGELRGELAELKALGRTGRYREAVARGQALAKRVQALQYRPLEAEVLFETGQLERDVGGANAASRTMEQAVWAAEAGRNDEMAALAMTHLMFERATEGRFDEALAFRPRIAAVIERLGGNDDLEGHFHLTLGRVFFENSRLEESQAESEAGLAKLERHGDREALEVADGLDYLGETVLLRKGGSAARPIFERSLAIKRKIYGREHPEVAIAYARLSNALIMQSKYEEAQLLLENALAVGERAFGAEHSFVVSALSNLADLLDARGDLGRALPLHRRAVGLAAKVFGTDHPLYGEIVMSHGSSLVQSRRNEEGLTTARAALAILEPKLGALDRRVASCRDLIARALHQMGRDREALQEQQRALPYFDREGEPARAPVFRQLGEIELALGKSERAVATLERANAFAATSVDLDPIERGKIAFALGRALVARHQSGTRARALAEDARKLLSGSAKGKLELAELDRWQRRQGWP